ncbi:MAG: HAD family hydrolase [Desulfobacteraceae bacterium]|nr:HAD family hydrolase [Desulfobacteraceae bacterium]
MNPDLKAVLFDLDGTLLDSFSAHYGAYEIMFAHFGIELVKKRFLSTYSPNWYETYQAFGLPEKHWDSANRLWLEAMEKNHTLLFPGVAEILAILHRRYTLGLVTSGSKSRVTTDLARTQIEHLFSIVVTGDDIQKPKPSPEGLNLALLELGVRPGETVYIGDALADYEMALAAGVSFIGVKSDFANLNSDDPSYQVYPIKHLPDLLPSGR